MIDRPKRWIWFQSLPDSVFYTPHKFQKYRELAVWRRKNYVKRMGPDSHPLLHAVR